MAHYKVGRPAIREALQSLERAGIVTITHGERARVAVPTAETLIQQLAGGARRGRGQRSRGDHCPDAAQYGFAHVVYLVGIRGCCRTSPV